MAKSAAKSGAGDGSAAGFSSFREVTTSVPAATQDFRSRYRQPEWPRRAQRPQRVRPARADRTRNLCSRHSRALAPGPPLQFRCRPPQSQTDRLRWHPQQVLLLPRPQALLPPRPQALQTQLLQARLHRLLLVVLSWLARQFQQAPLRHLAIQWPQGDLQYAMPLQTQCGKHSPSSRVGTRGNVFNPATKASHGIATERLRSRRLAASGQPARC
jgi:hypothetical protein